jgi:adenine-specific DNA-methyltransferase
MAVIAQKVHDLQITHSCVREGEGRLIRAMSALIHRSNGQRKLLGGANANDQWRSETSREDDLIKIERALEGTLRLVSENVLVAQGDSLSLLRRLPDSSVSLILTDPPYHSTKKQNIYGDTSFKHHGHYIEWLCEYAKEWRRILRPNGSLYCFCASEMAAHIEVMLDADFNVLSRIVWTKPNEPGFDGWKGKVNKASLRQWYPHSERIIFAEPAVEGNLCRSPFGDFLTRTRKQAGLSTNQLAEIIGAYGKVNHGGAVSNWEAGRNVPSPDQYRKMCEAIIDTGKVESMPSYEDAIRPFTMDGSLEFKDVWDFPSVRPYKGKHPAEKPATMLEHAIAASSSPGDLVLDCFAGSGSTVLAALKLGRRGLAMEIEPQWADEIAARVDACGANSSHLVRVDHDAREIPATRINPKVPQFNLFEVGAGD